ncbi:amidohydrolase family protein [Fulvivirgaceae bacterium PWU4]|uniref:Amidohydrolase family protein n=1 Tax=Chryseosolibacter histidini TaxID=2782349 RepID=A0AAP2GPG1_9BACT|nr:amidohydrolase family protein [Chryseosolibacter histidini]MBT1699083.1 amidohydrolase family protein [Chryseosolibacter histidini]
MKRFYRSRICLKFMVMLALGWPALLQAQQFQQQPQEEKELSPVSRTYAITNATVFQGPGRKLDRATVVMKDGLITAVGKGVAIPPEAIIIKGDSLYIYAGFIDGLSRAGVSKPKEEANRERPKDPGNPTPELAGITPQNDVRTFLNPSDKSADDLRALGFTAAQVVPYGNMLPGSGAIIQLTGKTSDAMVLAGKSALFSELTGAPRVYPSTILAVMSKWRELYRQAVQNKNYETMYAANRAGLSRPASDRILEAFYPVIDKRIPVLFEADKYLETQRVMTLQSELGFSLVLGDVKEGWDAIARIKSSGAKVFLSLDLPEDKKEEKSKDKKEEAGTLTPAEKEALEKRKAEFLALYTGQAATFQKAGVTFGFSSLSAKTSDIRTNLRRMIKAGLTEDQALAALTTSPAQLLGLSDRLGTVDNGKIASLVLSDKPYFHEKARVRYVFVDGIMYKYDVKETPKADAGAKAEITGTWSVTTETPQGKSEETVTFKKDGSNYSGSITGGRLAQAVSLEKVELNGNALRYSYTVQVGGQSFKVDVDATVDGSSYKGSATVGQYGSFPVEGKKDPNR